MEDIRSELRDEQQEINRYLNNTQVRSFYLTVIATSLTAWTLMFNLGVYDTVFFRSLLSIWVICSVIFVATLMLPQHERPLGAWQLATLLLPTLWMISYVFAPERDAEAYETYEIIINVLSVLSVLSLPNLGYALFIIMQGDVLRLPNRLFYAMVLIVLIVSVIGYLLGSYHFLFMSCQEFTVAGDFAPPNCYNQP